LWLDCPSMFAAIVRGSTRFFRDTVADVVGSGRDAYLMETPAVQSERIRLCSICKHSTMEHFAIRADGAEILRCNGCGMGVLADIPSDPAAVYDDNYYGLNGNGPKQDGVGYDNYSYTAEHGVAWAAALVRLIRPDGGRVLDIGCGDGRLLGKLGS